MFNVIFQRLDVSDGCLRATLDILSELSKLNQEVGFTIPVTFFYVLPLSVLLDLKDDYIIWMAGKHKKLVDHTLEVRFVMFYCLNN
jgi:hypothetical protein